MRLICACLSLIHVMQLYTLLNHYLIDSVNVHLRLLLLLFLADLDFCFYFYFAVVVVAVVDQIQRLDEEHEDREYYVVVVVDVVDC